MEISDLLEPRGVLASLHAPNKKQGRRELARRAAEVTGRPELLTEADECKTLEDRVCRASDVLLYPSAEECDYVRSAFPKASGVVEFPITIFSPAEMDRAVERICEIPEGTSSDFLFVGGFNHSPNSTGSSAPDTVMMISASSTASFAVSHAIVSMPWRSSTTCGRHRSA